MNMVADIVEATTGAPMEGTSTAEDLISRSHATDLIKKEKEAAYRKAQREFQSELDSLKTGQTQNMGGMQANNEEMVQQLLDKRFKELEDKHQSQVAEQRKQEYAAFVNDQARSYLEKMDKSGDLAEDFKEMTARFKPDKFKELFFLANSYDNTPSIIYELGKFPEKLLELDRAMERDPDLAKIMMDRLAESIKFNEDARENNVSAAAPITRPKPSLAAGAKSEQMSLAELKKSPFLRG